jgi:hypothetical protein
MGVGSCHGARQVRGEFMRGRATRRSVFARRCHSYGFLTSLQEP